MIEGYTKRDLGYPPPRSVWRLAYRRARLARRGDPDGYVLEGHPGIRIDAAKIAEGILAMVPDLERDSGVNYSAALAFGMLPAPLMDVCERMLAEKATAIYEDGGPEALRETFPEGSRGHDVVEQMATEIEHRRADFVRKALHAVSVEMYRQAEMVV